LVLRDGTQQMFGPRDDVLQALRQAAQPQQPAASGAMAPRPAA
jgi:ATP-binding cassette subfamily C exporter for protease/lipase